MADEEAKTLTPPDHSVWFGTIITALEKKNYADASKLLREYGEQYAAYAMAVVERQHEASVAAVQQQTNPPQELVEQVAMALAAYAWEYGRAHTIQEDVGLYVAENVGHYEGEARAAIAAMPAPQQAAEAPAAPFPIVGDSTGNRDNWIAAGLRTAVPDELVREISKAIIKESRAHVSSRAHLNDLNVLIEYYAAAAAKVAARYYGGRQGERESGHDMLAKDLAMLCRRLAYRLTEKREGNTGDNLLVRQTTAFLEKHGLEGTALRTEDEQGKRGRDD